MNYVSGNYPLNQIFPSIRMKLLDKIGREFFGFNVLESGERLFDRKPLQCSLYILSLPSLLALS